MVGKNEKTLSLVLGGGGARGLAHIGVIHWLEENDFTIRSIAGTSIGALIGGIYAAGKLDEFELWVRSITKVDMVALLDLAWEKSGLFRGDKLINTLIELVGEQLIEDLPISYSAVATDIKGQKEIWIKSGSLFDAIRASISIPLLFTPYRYKGVDLVDGGVLNPVPIAPTFGDETDMTIAVNLGGPAEGSEKQGVGLPEPDKDDRPVQEIVCHDLEEVTHLIQKVVDPILEGVRLLADRLVARQNGLVRIGEIELEIELRGRIRKLRGERLLPPLDAQLDLLFGRRDLSGRPILGVRVDRADVRIRLHQDHGHQDIAQHVLGRIVGKGAERSGRKQTAILQGFVPQRARTAPRRARRNSRSSRPQPGEPISCPAFHDDPGKTVKLGGFFYFI